MIARYLAAGLVGAALLTACGGGGHGSSAAPANGGASNARKPDSTVSLTLKFPTNLVRGAKTKGTRSRRRAPKFLDPGPAGGPAPIVMITSTDIYGSSSKLCVAAAPAGDGTQTIAAVPMYSEGGSLTIQESAGGSAGVGDSCTTSGNLLAQTQGSPNYNGFPAGQDVAFSSLFSSPVALYGVVGSLLYSYEGYSGWYASQNGNDFEQELCTDEPTVLDFLAGDLDDVGVGQSASNSGSSSTLTTGFPAVTISNVSESGTPEPVASGTPEPDAPPTIGSGSVPGSISIGPTALGVTVNFTVTATDVFGGSYGVNEAATAFGACGEGGVS